MKNKKIIINSNINEYKGNISTFNEITKSMEILNNINNYFYRTDEKCWAKILDFLTYKELTVVAQLNKNLRNISKNHKLLNKFFKEKDYNKEIILEKKTNKTHSINVPNNYNNNIIIHSQSKFPSNKTLENKSSYSLEKNKINNLKKNEKKISFYEDYFTKKKINIQQNNLYINKFTPSQSICSSSVGYYDHTPSFSDDNMSNRRSFYNITNITNININKFPGRNFNDS